MSIFKLKSNWKPKGDQPKAIKTLVQAYKRNKKHQTLLGVTGSGKTFVMANVIQKLGIPALIMAPNKTLAAQLYSEFKNFFPENAVEYFVSYYDFYQPEAYIPQRDIYIEKDASINEQIDRLRMAATSSLMLRKDVIIVASISCIYSLGDPQDYKKMVLPLKVGEDYRRDDILYRLVDMQYSRNDYSLERGNFRVRGDVIDIWPSYQEITLRLELFGDLLERMRWCNPLTGEILENLDETILYPAKHHVMPQEKIESAIGGIEKELSERLAEFKTQNKLLEATRLDTKTRYDIEMLREVGFCSGIENYSIHFSSRTKGDRPHCLLDYFPKDYLTVVDESHVTIPQLRGMYNGDKARKQTLVEHGFRLPTALDNRPNTIHEWENITNKILFVSATPGEYEVKKSGSKVVDLVVRPTGLVDPIIEVHPAQNQVKDLLKIIKEKANLKERVLITTLTKRLAEDLTDYYLEENINIAYLHCDIDAFERVEILQDLRRGKYDAVVGINLLREGLDLPEVSLVAILDADREGFLRSETSLIQTIGRSARHVNAKVILYADRITKSMKYAIEETKRRREIQLEHNKKHNITPASVQKEILDSIDGIFEKEKLVQAIIKEEPSKYQIREKIHELESEMLEAATALDFEKAANIRDQIYLLQGKKVNNKRRKARKARKI